MLYNTGTIAINGNTATGTGTNWTAPASQVRAGQTIIVMSNPVQLFQISSVNSATSMTVTPAASPALSGQKYAILVSDIISVDGLAQSMSQLIKEYDENIGAWETFATTSANQSITVTINGTSVTIPGIGKLAQKGSNGAVAVADGGTGATNAADARTNLGLGSGATRDVGSEPGNVVTSGSTQPQYRTTLPAVGYNDLGDYGYKATSTLPPDSVAKTTTTLVQTSGWTLGVSYGIYNSSDNSPENAAHLLIMTDGGGYVRRYYFYNNGDIVGPSGKFYSEKNTTVDTNGFIKKASPVVRLFGDGTLKSNNEAEGVTAARKSAGVYHVAGSLGLNPEGWTVEIPQDMNGNFLCFVDISTDEDGVLTVSTFKRRFDVDSAMIVAGEPMDIPDGRWIDLRLGMPEDSIWNRKQAEYRELEKLTGFDGS